jgi:osmotically-inducible protein OsmY
MLSEQTTNTLTKQASRCDERALVEDYGNSLSPVEKQDAGLKTDIADALWKDDVLRALDFHEIDIRVKSGVVILNGHITSSRSQNRVGNILRTIPGIVEIKNNLVSDDKLALDVATALGSLEHTYGCKFFTGASHGVVSINGFVKNKDIRLLAEKCASDTPNARGVINNIQVDGGGLEVQKLPFMQPAIGENIYFLDWASGVVKQVIMNPNNRRVIAMIISGKLTSQKTEKSIIIPMSTVRHLTKVSGFLYITSDQRNQYMDFSPGHFIAPPQSWASPYPYCPDDILFPVEYKNNNTQIEYRFEQYSFSGLSKHTPLGAQLLANDSLGG